MLVAGWLLWARKRTFLNGCLSGVKSQKFCRLVLTQKSLEFFDKCFLTNKQSKKRQNQAVLIFPNISDFCLKFVRTDLGNIHMNDENFLKYLVVGLIMKHN